MSDAARSARQALYGAAWRKARELFLRAHPTCESCGNPASEVDHVTPHKGDLELFWRKSNWQALCKSCHSRKTAYRDGRWGWTAPEPGFDESGRPLDPGHWWH